jgi:hypothetical protein
MQLTGFALLAVLRPVGRPWRNRMAGVLLFCICASASFSQTVTLNESQPLYAPGVPFVVSGIAPPNVIVTISIEGIGKGQTTADSEGKWELLWTAPMKTGTYDITASAEGGGSVTQILRVQEPGFVVRQSGIERTFRYGNLVLPNPDAVQEMTDRWRITPPPYELDEKVQARRIGNRGITLDPYNQNLIKGDLPIWRNDTFLNITGISDTLVESRAVPTPANPSGARPGNFTFFGENDQGAFVQNLILSADLFQGLTAFQPVRQRVKATLIGNLNHVRVEEVGILKPDVRRGKERTDSHFALQEIFYERLLKVLTPNYDFVSVRVGSQPFVSDFRGFIFSDTNLGVRVFGNYAANRFQYNLAFFERLEKDTNSGLNRLTEFRDQRVAIANFYWQDFFRKGYTQQFSIHWMQDDASFKFDRNGILVRPAPVGVFTPHEIQTIYLGQSGFGHFGRINVDHAFYYVFGKDDLNSIAGPDPRLRHDVDDSVDVSAMMAALEVSFDKDWLRPKLAFFYASGDNDPRDRNATGFDSIFDSPNFAGGGFSFFNRLGIRLAGTGVTLVDRGSLFTSLRSSKDEGQPNYVNPGVVIVSPGLDMEVTPRLKAIFTANYIRLATTEPLEAILFQDNIRKELGLDVSVGLKYRPFITNNVVLVGGAAVFVPGQGFKDIYESGETLYHVFTNLILQF